MTRKGNRGGAGRRTGQPSAVDWTGRTTAMVRNIPSCYTQKDLLAELDARGWEETYDFFYLPFDQQKKTNCGYCFMNFKDPSLAAALHQALDSAQLAKGRGRKRLQVVPAVVQGYVANLEHFQHSAVLNHHRPEHAPLFLREAAATNNAATRAVRGSGAKRRARTPPLEQLGSFGENIPLPLGVTTLTLYPIPAVLSQPMLYVELVRASVGYSVDFLHITTDGEAVVNFESPAAASHAASILQGMSLLGSPGLSIGVAKIQGCGANILHYATQGMETDPKRTPFAQSFQYTCPVPQELPAEVPSDGARLAPANGYPAPANGYPALANGYPALANGYPALSAVDMNVEGSLMRSPKTSRFASLGIELDSEPAEPGASTTSWPQTASPPLDRSPPRSGPAGSVDPTVNRAVKRAQDMERALHAGFPDMLSSPACAHIPLGVGSSRGSSSDSRTGLRSSTPPLSAADATSFASTPPAPPCSPRRGTRVGLPPRVPAA